MENNLKRETEIQEINPISCPNCGSNMIATYLYGLPLFSEEQMKALEEGKIKLGGCDITDDDPVYYCNSCGRDFQKIDVNSLPI